MSDRGMKKWNAYKALIEQEPKNIQMQSNRNKKERPILSEDKEQEMNEILSNYNGQTLIVTIYKNGYLYDKEINIKIIDPYERKLIMYDRSYIYLKDIVDIKIKEEFEF